MAVISDRIFELIRDRGMTQKEFAQKTDIAQSTISDWKRRGVNPASEKIMIISQVLGVSPEELLSGATARGTRSRKADCQTISYDTEEGKLLKMYDSFNERQKQRLMGYAMAMMEMKEMMENPDDPTSK